LEYFILVIETELQKSIITMAGLFSCFSSKTRKKEHSLEDATERGNDTIERETVVFNRDLQKLLIAKATKKGNDFDDLFCFPIPDRQQPITITTVSDAIGSGQESRISSGWVHFACDNKNANSSNTTSAATPASSAVTCNARNHKITGQGEDPDGTEFTIVKGKWSPAGNYYWVEQRTRNNSKKEELTFVLQDMSESEHQSATIFHNNGSKTRTRRTMDLVIGRGETNEDVSSCPSVQTAARMALQT